jgi:hypothetical protein
MDHGVLIAIQRFPARQRAIEALAARDEDFRSLCADFAEAQAALRRWEEPSSAVRENVRENLRSEYQTLVEELAGEIAGALDTAAVIPLAGRRPPPREGG